MECFTTELSILDVCENLVYASGHYASLDHRKRNVNGLLLPCVVKIENISSISIYFHSKEF